MRRWEIWTGAGVVAGVVLALIVLLGRGGSHTSSPGLHTSSPGSHTSPPGPPRMQFGASVNRLFNDRIYSPAQIAAQLDALRRTGATVARSDALWELAEPSPPVGGTHHYDWTFDDLIAASLARSGLRWLPIVDYAALWAAVAIPGQGHPPPTVPVGYADYAAFAAALAARYGPHGAFWASRPGLAPLPVESYEIWNEPDNPALWTPRTDPGAYGTMYLQARAAIRAVDPHAIVIVGGLSRLPAFLPLMMHAVPALRNRIDAVGIHPYGNTPADVLGAVIAARRIMHEVGLGAVPLDVTEFGWTTSPQGAKVWAPPAVRPRYIAESLSDLARSGCGIDVGILYTWVTPERHRSDPEDWYGIHPPGGGSSADTVAFTQALAAARSVSAKPAAPLCGSS